MVANHQTGRCAFHLFFVAGAALALVGCVADGTQPGVNRDMRRTSFSTTSAQPRQAIYKCGNEGSITVQASANGVRLVDAEGAEYDLPASPPTQQNRFGEGSVALVVEGGEALWMKAGREPMTCRQ